MRQNLTKLEEALVGEFSFESLYTIRVQALHEIRQEDDSVERYFNRFIACTSQLGDNPQKHVNTFISGLSQETKLFVFDQFQTDFWEILRTAKLHEAIYRPSRPRGVQQTAGAATPVCIQCSQRACPSESCIGMINVLAHVVHELQKYVTQASDSSLTSQDDVTATAETTTETTSTDVTAADDTTSDVTLADDAATRVTTVDHIAADDIIMDDEPEESDCHSSIGNVEYNNVRNEQNDNHGDDAKQYNDYGNIVETDHKSSVVPIEYTPALHGQKRVNVRDASGRCVNTQCLITAVQYNFDLPLSPKRSNDPCSSLLSKFIQFVQCTAWHALNFHPTRPPDVGTDMPRSA